MSAPQEFTKHETINKDFDNQASQAALHKKEGEIKEQSKNNIPTKTTGL